MRKNLFSRINLKSESIPKSESQNSPENPVQQGEIEAQKESVKQENINKQKLDNLVSVSEKIIFKAKTIFPLDLFPTTLVIDLNQIHLISKMFLLSDRIRSINIQDIGDIFVVTLPFFATLNIIDNNAKEQPVILKYLHKYDAVKARKIIQGMIISKKMQIDLTSMKDDENLVQKLEKLGDSKMFNGS